MPALENEATLSIPNEIFPKRSFFQKHANRVMQQREANDRWIGEASAPLLCRVDEAAARKSLDGGTPC